MYCRTLCTSSCWQIFLQEDLLWDSSSTEYWSTERKGCVCGEEGWTNFSAGITPEGEIIALLRRIGFLLDMRLLRNLLITQRWFCFGLKAPYNLSLQMLKSCTQNWNLHEADELENEFRCISGTPAGEIHWIHWKAEFGNCGKTGWMAQRHSNPSVKEGFSFGCSHTLYQTSCEVQKHSFGAVSWCDPLMQSALISIFKDQIIAGIVDIDSTSLFSHCILLPWLLGFVLLVVPGYLEAFWKLLYLKIHLH